MRLPNSMTLAKFSSFQIYVAYLALKSHFTSPSYNVFKYNGRVNVKAETFETRRDAYVFEKLSQQKDPIGLLVSNLVVDPNRWAGVILSDGQDDYIEWKKRQESLTYRYTEELNALGDIDEALEVKHNGLPLLLNKILGHEFSLESAIMLNSALNYVPYWDGEIQVPIAWIQTRLFLTKYAPFLEFDKDKIKALTEARLNHD